MPAPYRGSCLCGAVRYEVDATEPKMGHCHCSMCRKFHGAAYATFGEAKAENFRWLSGEDQLKDYVAENGTTRRFCNQCGSSMVFQAANDDGSVVEFSLGTLDDEIDHRPDVRIYVGSKADWDEISDDLPRFVDGRDSDLLG